MISTSSNSRQVRMAPSKAVAVWLVMAVAIAQARPVAELAMRGSCTFQNQWTGETCLEFRGGDWTSDAMVDRCATESESAFSVAGCPTSENQAGWCVTTTSTGNGDDNVAVEATSMMVTAQSDCAFNEMACETFLGGAFESAQGCSSGGDVGGIETGGSAIAPSALPVDEESASPSSPADATKPVCDKSLTHSAKLGCPAASSQQLMVSYNGSSLSCGDAISVEGSGVFPTVRMSDADADAVYSLLLVDTSESPVHPILHYGAINLPGELLKFGFSLDVVEENAVIFEDYRGPNPPLPGSSWSTPEVQQTLFVYEYMLAEQTGGDIEPDLVMEAETMRFDYESFFEGTVGTPLLDVLSTHFMSGRCTFGDASTDILIESFDNPKFLWESIMVDNMANSGDGMNNAETEYTEINDNTEETYGMNMMGMGWREEYYESIQGSSMEIVDGVLLFTTNISDFNRTMMESQMMGNDGNTQNMLSANARGVFPDLTSCDGLKFVVKQTNSGGGDQTEAYDGYKIDIGYTKMDDSLFGYGYRASLALSGSKGADAPTDLMTSAIDVARQADNNKSGDEFTTVIIPFEDFTLDWDWNTGEANTLCKDDDQYCPDKQTLKNMETITITAIGSTNGVAQELHIKSISGTGCDVSAASTGSIASDEDSINGGKWTCSSEIGSDADEIMIETFVNPSFGWITQNDPVMGGESFSSVTMMDEEGSAFFSGEIKDVPFLGVPGYIQMEARGGEYPDASCCSALKLNVMGMEEYAGYRVSFGTRRAKTGFFAQGYKADFDAPVNEFGDVIIPFDQFSVEWDEATGDQIITCAEDPTVCPDLETLKNMETMAIWGEGVGGVLNLYVRSISAVGCSGDFPAMPDAPTTQDIIDAWKEKNSVYVTSSSSSKTLVQNGSTIISFLLAVSMVATFSEFFM